MPIWLICLIFSVATGTWIYSWFARRTGGGNNRTALIAASISAVLIFFVIYSIASLLE
ncbi:MAG: hypothetical protein M3Q70_01165 [bacterium]|nr:hypothetical protein [bacterium]